MVRRVNRWEKDMSGEDGEDLLLMIQPMHIIPTIYPFLYCLATKACLLNTYKQIVRSRNPFDHT